MGLRHTFVVPAAPDRVLPDLHPGERSLDAILAGFSSRAASKRGLLSATGVIPRAEYDDHPEAYEYGTEWQVVDEDDGNRTIFAGRLLDPVVGVALVTLTAIGWGKKMETGVGSIVWDLGTDTELWSIGDTDPHTYDTDSQFQVKITAHQIVFKVEKGTPFKRNGAGAPAAWTSAVVAYVEGENFSHLDIEWDTDHPDEYELEICKANGPDGALTVLHTIDLEADPDGTRDQDLDTNRDLVALRVRRTAATDNADEWKLVIDINHLGALAPGDTYDTSEMMKDVFDRVGATTAGVEDSGRNGLPMWALDARYADVADLIALFDDWPYGIYDHGAGPVGIYRPWGDTVWKKADTERADPQLAPSERYTDVVIPYRSKGGVRRSKRYQAPAINGIRNDFVVPFDDPLPNLATADLIGPVLAASLAEMQQGGEIEVELVEDVDDPGVVVRGVAHEAWRQVPHPRPGRQHEPTDR